METTRGGPCVRSFFFLFFHLVHSSSGSDPRFVRTVMTTTVAAILDLVICRGKGKRPPPDCCELCDCERPRCPAHLPKKIFHAPRPVSPDLRGEVKDEQKNPHFPREQGSLLLAALTLSGTLTPAVLCRSSGNEWGSRKSAAPPARGTS